MKRGTRIKPATRLSIGVAFLAATAILGAEALGLISDPLAPRVEGRARLAEAIAWHCSSAVAKDDTDKAMEWAGALVQGNPDLVSVGLRRADGQLVAATAGHAASWAHARAGRSTPTHMQFPVRKDNTLWGTAEVSFVAPPSPWLLGSGLALVAFIVLSAYGLSRVYLGHVLKRLDPSAVIPERVKAMLDTMSEGVLVLDNDERIVMANAAFLATVGESLRNLLGREVSKMPWKRLAQSDQQRPLPWTAAAQTGESQAGEALTMEDKAGRTRLFMVNASPIFGEGNQQRGLLATLDDVTGLEETNVELRTALERLEVSQHKIAQQNDVLQQQKQSLEEEVCRRRKAEERLWHNAFHDNLTGLPNRALLKDQLSRAIARRKRDPNYCFAVLFVDLDNFKVINDNLGHDAGDRVLVEVGNRLQSALRLLDTTSRLTDDITARLGGDEFVILLDGLQQHSDASIVADRLQTVLSEPFAIKGYSLQVTASIGVAVSDHEYDLEDDVLRDADIALYAAKAGGKARYMQFTEDMREPAAKRMHLGKDLRQALAGR